MLCETLDDELVLLKMNGQECYGLSEVGARVWSLIAEHGDTATVAERLCEEYEGEKAAILKDFRELVREMLEAGLLQSADTPTDSDPTGADRLTARR